MVWIGIIGFMIWIWSATITLFVPLMWKDGGGITAMKNSFRAHRRGLMLYFLVSTAIGAASVLTPTVYSGVIVGAVIAAIMVLKNPGP